MVSKQIISIYSKNYTRSINTECRVINFKVHGTYSSYLNEAEIDSYMISRWKKMKNVNMHIP